MTNADIPAALDHPSSSLNFFHSLLVQLRKEHDREIASLKDTINLLKTQLNVNDPIPSCEGPSPMPGCDSRGKLGVNNTVPSSTDCSKGCDNTVPSRPSFNKSPSLDHGATMNWNLSLSVLEEEATVAAQLIDGCARSCIGRTCGMTQEMADKWKDWWKNMREPDRERKSCLRNVVDGSRFQNFIISCILLNTAFIVYTSETAIQKIQDDPDNYDTQNVIYLSIDLIFTAIYTVELAMKLFVHGHFFLWGEDWKWNLFDAVLVGLALFDSVLSLALLEDDSDRPNVIFLFSLRIMKLTKILRLLRAIRWIQELRLMLECVMNSVSHLFWCVIFILLVLLLFSLLLVQGFTSSVSAAHAVGPENYETSKANIKGYFDSVPHAMLSLFKAATGGADWQDLYIIVGDAGDFYEVVFLFYIAFFCIVVWNIVMSVFVEKAIHLATPDRDAELVMKKQRDLLDAKQLFEILQQMDENDNGLITLKEFKNHYSEPSLKAFFLAHDLDMKDAELFFHMISSVYQRPDVDLNTFVSGILRLRGSASSIDVETLHFEMKMMDKRHHEELLRLSEKLVGYLEEISMNQRLRKHPSIMDNASMTADSLFSL